MALARLALRLAAIEALLPSAVAATGPYPTVAGAQVYDSRLDPIADPDAWEAFLTEVEGNPIVIVYTEEHETEPKPGSEFPAEVEIVDLVVETMIAARAELEVQGPEGPVTIGTLAAPVTDRVRGATLDLLEAQIRNAFDTASLATARIFQQVAWEVRHIASVPQREATGSARVAARTCKFKVKVASDQCRKFPPRPRRPGSMSCRSRS